MTAAEMILVSCRIQQQWLDISLQLKARNWTHPLHLPKGDCKEPRKQSKYPLFFPASTDATSRHCFTSQRPACVSHPEQRPFFKTRLFGSFAPRWRYCCTRPATTPEPACGSHPEHQRSFATRQLGSFEEFSSDYSLGYCEFRPEIQRC